MANRNRSAGHSFEREIVKLYKEIGFKEAVTCRYASRMMDDLKVDICQVDPLYNQCKDTQKNVDHHKILSDMPEEKGKINILLHRKRVKQGSRFYKKGDYAILEMNDFMKMVKFCKDNGFFD